MSDSVELFRLAINVFWKSLLSTTFSTDSGSEVGCCSTCVGIHTETRMYSASPAFSLRNSFERASRTYTRLANSVCRASMQIR